MPDAPVCPSCQGGPVLNLAGGRRRCWACDHRWSAANRRRAKRRRRAQVAAPLPPDRGWVIHEPDDRTIPRCAS